MTYTAFHETARRLAEIFGNENANEVIDDVLKDIIIEMENESQISSYHPEVIKVVYPLMVEKLQEIGEGFDSAIQCVLDSNYTQVKKFNFDAQNLHERVSRFLSAENASEVRRQSLIDYIGYEFIERETSLMDESILPHALAQLEKDVSPEDFREIYGQIERILEGKELWSYEKEVVRQKGKLFDLSEVEAPKEDECIDLAKPLSFVLNHPKLPKAVYEAIHNELGMLNQPEKIIDSPEYIAELLCNN